MARVVWVTGCDTGVGKTVVAAALVRSLSRGGRRVLGVKPFCSGGREDVTALATAQGLGEDACARLNPWFFPEPLTPLLAARKAGRRVARAEVLHFLRQSMKGQDALVVEGAGGLLSPLGEDYDARDLIRRTPGLGRVVVVVPNRLGAINQALLVMDALGTAARQARVALVSPPRPTPVSRTNLALLRERLGASSVVAFPWLPRPESPSGGRRMQRAVAALLA